MTQLPIHHLPPIASTLPSSARDPVVPSPSWSRVPLPGSHSYSRVPTPPLLQPRAAVDGSSYTPSPSYLPPLHSRPTLDDSPPIWNRVPSTNSLNSVSTGSRSPLPTPRDAALFSYDFGSSQPIEPWQPKPRVWTEQRLFDDLKPTPRDTDSPRMHPHQPQMGIPLMGGTSISPHDAAPIHFGGGLGAAFPELLPPQQPTDYESMAHPSMAMGGDSDPYRFSPDRPHVGPAEYAQALEVFRHIQLALPHIRPVDLSAPPASGQPYRSIIDCASTAIDMLNGRIPARASLDAATHPRPTAVGGGPEKRIRIEKDKPYCRGCGATETPEWRRGPLGPRTLCNACGLVHRKMTHKKKKAEEKAAVAAAAAAAHKSI